MIYFNNIQININSKDYLGNEDFQLKLLNGNKEYRELLYSDLTLLGTEELGISSSSGGIDLGVTSGIVNLAQAVHHRLITERGTLPEDRTLGIPWNDFLGKTYSNVDTLYRNLYDAIYDEIMRDERVEAVSDLSLNLESPTVIAVQLTVVALQNSFTVAFEASQ